MCRFEEEVRSCDCMFKCVHVRLCESATAPKTLLIRLRRVIADGRESSEKTEEVSNSERPAASFSLSCYQIIPKRPPTDFLGTNQYMNGPRC